MSTSFNIERSWFASRQTTGFTVLSCFVSSSTLKFVLSREKRVWDAPAWGQTTGFSVLSWSVSSSKIKFWPSREKRGWVVCSEQTTVGCSWFSSRQTTGFSVLSCFTGSSRKEHVSISWERVPRSIMIWVWILLAWLVTFGLLSNFSFWLSSNFWTQIFHPLMFQGNLWRRTRWRIYFLVYDFSSFHPNNFRGTISWWCFVKNDGVRSCLIELQSFLLSKVDVDPIHRILMFLPCFVHVLCKTRCFQVDLVKILMVFVHGIHKQKEYCLFASAQIFDLPVSVLNW